MPGPPFFRTGGLGTGGNLRNFPNPVYAIELIASLPAEESAERLDRLCLAGACRAVGVAAQPHLHALYYMENDHLIPIYRLHQGYLGM